MMTTMILITTAIISFVAIFLLVRRITNWLIEKDSQLEASKPLNITRTVYPDGQVVYYTIHKVEETEQSEEIYDLTRGSGGFM